MTIVTSTSSYLNRKTPGVYITEIEAFGSSIVGVDTAVPVFVGYTEFAGDPSTGKPLYMVPTSISSMMDFTQYFGGPAPAGYSVTDLSTATDDDADATTSQTAPVPSFYADYTTSETTPSASTPFLLSPAITAGTPTQFNLYWSMMGFFANGGTACYIVSVGSYWTGQSPTAMPDAAVSATWQLQAIDGTTLTNGVLAAGYTVGPTMTVVPEACQLASYSDPTWTYNGYDTVVQTMLSQASVLQDRVAILDLPACQTANTYSTLVNCQTGLADAIAPAIAAASYGACYAPAVVASVVTSGNILYTNLQSTSEIVNDILTTQAVQLYSDTSLASVQSAIAAAFPLTTGPTTNTVQYSNDSSAYPSQAATQQTLAQWQLGLDNLLLASLPIFKQMETLVAGEMNVLPPSGFLAGVWAASDSQRGVWNAPANIALASTLEPLYKMSDAEQGGFNVPTNGEAIDIIRAQPSRGNVVWGARTLDGNSNDYRYIQVRRTLIYVEQSIKQALAPYVFAPNDSLTWGTVTAAIASFLTGLWQSGGLMGAKPSEAFTVSCGLGSTMTSQDILDGYMIVAVTLQMIHPAEFIELTFTQTMGS